MEDVKFAGVILLDAKEAIDKAETLMEISELKKEINKTKGEVLQEDKKNKVEEWRIKRHGPILSVQSDFILFYISGNHKSRRQAAKLFFEGLPKSKRDLFSEDNAIRTLTDALRKYEYGKFKFKG